MEFLYANYLDTTTQISVESNTLLAEKIMLRDATRQWFSDGWANDLTSTTITITFDTTTTISRIALDGINLKSFVIYYNGVTANTFNLTSTGMTTASNFLNNTEAAMFLTCTPTPVSSVSIQMRTTQTANSEKAIGYLLLSEQLMDFERIPSASNYNPRTNSEEIVHRMSDGGTKINVKDRKFSTDLKLKYISETFKADLKAVYESDTDFVFVAFPTTTGWDKQLAPVVWEGDFDFERFSDNNPASGREGSIRLRETSA
jgi:hypothetical protein